MKKFKFFSSILSMLIFFSLLVSFVSFSNLLINRPEQGFFAMLFSPVGLCFIILIFTAIAYLFHSQTLKNLLSNYDLIKATHNSILDSSLGFILSNIDGRIIISNNFAKETLEINESYDINIFEILSIKEKLEEDQGFINNRETTIIKHILKVKGKEKVLNIFVKEIENDHEPILLFLFNDLTESKKLLEVEKRFKALLNTLDEPIVLVNKYGYIKEFNSAFSEFVGLETQQIENQKFSKVLMNSKLFGFKELGKLGDIFEKMDETIGTGDISTLINPFKFEIIQNQTKRHYIKKLFKVNLNEEDYLLGCIISDITELQSTIEKLNNLNAELEQKIKEKTKELEDTIEKLSEINSLLKKENQERKE
ncbi:MAG: PAS domain S-box protein, partial [Ignavibacteria bacterium]|nr:PAS domain S-box protein [Ignavibacteria bacterium]